VALGYYKKEDSSDLSAELDGELILLLLKDEPEAEPKPDGQEPQVRKQVDVDGEAI